MDKAEKPTLKQAHLQTAQCQPSNQSLQKSLLCQRQEKNKKNSSFAKNKSADTLKLIDKQTNIAGGQKKPLLTTANHGSQPVSGHLEK